MPDLPVSAELLARIKREMISYSDKSIAASEITGHAKGRQTLVLHTDSPCLCLRLPSRQFGWLAAQSCADAVIFEFSSEQVILHIVELKSTIDPDTWDKIKKQVRGAYHNALAVGGVLERRGFAAIRVHVTCSDDRLSPQTSASPSSLKAGLGEPLRDSAADWLERRLTLDGIARISLNIILRDTDGSASTNLTRSP